jgi:predicted HicB family RNase H-like nuclease
MTKRPKLNAVFSGDAVSKPIRENPPAAPEPVAAERMVQLNVLVPETLRRQIKIKALQTGQDMNTVVKGLLTSWLEE